MLLFFIQTKLFLLLTLSRSHCDLCSVPRIIRGILSSGGKCKTIDIPQLHIFLSLHQNSITCITSNMSAHLYQIHKNTSSYIFRALFAIIWDYSSYIELLQSHYTTIILPDVGPVRPEIPRSQCECCVIVNLIQMSTFVGLIYSNSTVDPYFVGTFWYIVAAASTVAANMHINMCTEFQKIYYVCLENHNTVDNTTAGICIY